MRVEKILVVTRQLKGICNTCLALFCSQFIAFPSQHFKEWNSCTCFSMFEEKERRWGSCPIGAKRKPKKGLIIRYWHFPHVLYRSLICITIFFSFFVEGYETSPIVRVCQLFHQLSKMSVRFLVFVLSIFLSISDCFNPWMSCHCNSFFSDMYNYLPAFMSNDVVRLFHHRFSAPPVQWVS